MSEQFITHRDMGFSSLYVECSCASTPCTVRVVRDFVEGDFWIEFQLPKRNFWGRLKLAFKYLRGHTQVWNEISLNKPELYRLQDFLMSVTRDVAEEERRNERLTTELLQAGYTREIINDTVVFTRPVPPVKR